MPDRQGPCHKNRHQSPYQLAPLLAASAEESNGPYRVNFQAKVGSSDQSVDKRERFEHVGQEAALGLTSTLDLAGKSVSAAAVSALCVICVKVQTKASGVSEWAGLLQVEAA